LKIGKGCSFYHEGGHGERRWVIGWRYGVIRSIPTKGTKKNWVQIELQIRRSSWDVLEETWTPRPLERVWVHSSVINEPGDFTFHGKSDVEVFKERQAEKAFQQQKADKKTRAIAAKKASPKLAKKQARGRKTSAVAA
jgi:hypothetical protein